MSDIDGHGYTINWFGDGRLASIDGQFGFLGTVVPPDTTKPIVTLVSPSAGTQINPDTEIVFRCTDETSLGRTVVSVQLGANRELAHDETGFVGLYASSTKSAITGGFEFTLRRTGGWTVAPTIFASPADLGGNIAD